MADPEHLLPPIAGGNLVHSTIHFALSQTNVGGDDLILSLQGNNLGDRSLAIPEGTSVAATLLSDYIPVITAGSGTVTSYTINRAKYCIIGNFTFICLDFTITDIGTASGYLLATLPFVAYGYAIFNGREIATTGFSLTGTIGLFTSQIVIVKYDNTFLGVNGYRYVLNGFCENGLVYFP